MEHDSQTPNMNMCQSNKPLGIKVFFIITLLEHQFFYIYFNIQSHNLGLLLKRM